MTFEELKTEMNDSISRQTAVDSITAQHGVVDKSVAKRILMQLKPSKTEIMKSKLYNQLNDLIPFEDVKTIVIDSLEKAETIEDVYIGILIGVYKLGSKNSQDDISPEQPDIVHCKYCKHWMPYDWMFSEVWRSINMDDYSEDEIGCTYCEMHMGANDFCSRGERREDGRPD